MRKLKLFPKTFLYTFSLMIVIVAVSHLLIYILLPTVYNIRKRNELENDVAKLCEDMADTPDSERLPLVTEFAGKWCADISVSYDGYFYEINLLDISKTGRLNPAGATEDVNVIAEKSDGKIKISLSQNPGGGTDFFYVERILPNENGYVKATVSRQQIEDAVSTVIVILPITAFLCTLISILSALAYSHMLTKPIKQISSATKQMQELTSDVHCEIHTHDEMEAVVR